MEDAIGLQSVRGYLMQSGMGGQHCGTVKKTAGFFFNLLGPWVFQSQNKVLGKVFLKTSVICNHSEFIFMLIVDRRTLHLIAKSLFIGLAKYSHL